LYNKHDHALLIKNGDSALHFTKIVLNLHKDTLVVDVHKKLGIMESSSVLNWATTSWKINLQPNIGFVRFGKTLTPLSELKTYPVEGPGPYPKSPIIEVFPHTYPCEYK
jgi:hypothetical protein